MNPKGHKENLVAAQWGNQNAVKSGAHAKVADDEVNEVLALFHGVEEFTFLETVSAYDFAVCLVRMQRIDDYLQEKGVVREDGELQPITLSAIVSRVVWAN